MNIVSFDCETSGFDPIRESIIEIGAIKVNLKGKQIDKFSQLAHPGKRISKKIESLTGITNEMLEGKPSPHIVTQQFFDWLDDDSILIAHNASFDCKFVYHALNKKNIPVKDHRVICSLKWAQNKLNCHSYGLQNLMEVVGYHPKDTHRALPDAICSMKLVAMILRKYEHVESEERIRELLLSRSVTIKSYITSKRKKTNHNNYNGEVMRWN